MTNTALSQAEYDRTHTVQVKLKLNRRTDAALLRRLDEQPNKQGFIKALIKKDIEKEKENSMIDLINRARSGDFMPLLDSCSDTSDFCAEWRHCLLGDYGEAARSFAETHTADLRGGKAAYKPYSNGNFLPAVCYRDRSGEQWAAHFHREAGDITIRHYCQE